MIFDCFKKHKGKETFKTPKVEIVKRGLTDIELSIFSEVNRHREGMKLRSLISNLHLSNVAYHHNQFMIRKGNATHEGFPVRLAQTKELCQNDWMGEVLAKGYSTPKGVLKGWLKSKSHKYIVESEMPVFFGCSAIYDKKGKMYVTLLFID